MKRVRIWLEDSVEPQGGKWITGTVKDVEYTVTIKEAFVPDEGYRDYDELDTLKSYKKWGYKIEEL
jgi:hypothetical protein